MVLTSGAMRVTNKGQVTIPIEIRERLGLLPNSEVEFVVDGNSVRIQRTRSGAHKGRGHSIVQHLKGRMKSTMRTDHIMALTRDAETR